MNAKALLLGSGLTVMAAGCAAFAADHDPAFVTTTTARDLRTDYRITPLGLDRLPPKLFWRIEAGGRPGARQSAYRIQAGLDRDTLMSGNDVVWDSGRVDSAETTQIAYAGPKLESRQRIWWRVKVWDENALEGRWSEPTWFETGLLAPKDWRAAAWIGCDRDFRAPELAPDGMMGDWIVGPAGRECSGLFQDVALPDKPVVSAMAWWGLSRSLGAASVVANFDSATPADRGAMVRAGRGSNGGFLDLAFYLRPGQTNRVELKLRTPVKDVAATVGMRMVFADGDEILLRSGAGWLARHAGASTGTAPVKVTEPYGGPVCGKAQILPQTSLPPAWFRSTVEVRQGLTRARLYLGALGYGMPYVNGVFAGDGLLSPPQSDYETLAFYSTHDITRLLNPGPNALAVLLDGGWYHEVGGFGTVFSYGRPGLKAMLALDYGEGKTEWLVSGPDWQWKEGAIRSANIYRGERVDYRRDHEEWKTPASGNDWKPAQVLPPLTPRLTAMDVVPVRATREFKPVKRWQVGPKTWMFDVGEMIHGWVRLKFDEPAGSTVRLRYAEYAESGRLWNVPRSHWWCHGMTQCDEVISDGTARVFEPVFTPKSFRYVEVSGLGREPREGDLTAFLVHTDAPALAEFESSDPVLNRLFANGMRSFRNYMNHMFGDIPRERCLWGAESTYSWVPAFNCFDWAPNHRLMDRLWLTGKMAPGGVPGDIGVGLRMHKVVHDFTWSISPLFLTSKMVDHYGDWDLAKGLYGTLHHILDHYERTAEGGVIPKEAMYGDHAATKDIKRPPINKPLVEALNFFDAERYFARLADGLGKKEDAAHARAHAEKIRSALLRYYDPKKHTFGNGTHDSLALAFGVIRDPAEAKALAASMAGYYRANGHKFDGGFMTYELYPMLSRHGYVDDALKMLRNPGYPGPAWSVREYDATTYWEAYYLDKDFQMNRGLNFIAFAHPTGWMMTDLAGIRADPDVPGGRRLILAPSVPATETLDWVKASMKTMHGTVASAWKLEAGNLAWTFTIPPNTTAEIRVPADEAGLVKGMEAAKALGFHLGLALYEGGPGDYSIHSRVTQRTSPATPLPRKEDDAGAGPNGKEWELSPGSVARFEAGCMVVTAGRGPTQMLTTALPPLTGGNASVRFRLKTAATQAGMIRLVSMLDGKKTMQTVEFKLGPAGVWQEYTVAIPPFQGNPFSLWIGLAGEKEALTFGGISLLDNKGVTLKSWQCGDKN